MSVQLTRRFTILETLGEGGGGRVLLAEDTRTGRQVALKLLGESERHPDGVLRFKREFQLMADLRHPGLLHVYEYGQTDDGTPFYAMELVDGLEPEGPMPGAEAEAGLTELARILGYIHTRGYVHADVGRGNVKRGTAGYKLLDFGLMAPQGHSAGRVRGTPAYMAPESVRGGRLDARTDLYSLGVLAYQWVTGRLPFDEEEPIALMKAHLEREPLAPSRVLPDVSPDLERILLRLLQKDPARRFQSAAELLEALGADRGDLETTLLPSPFIGREEERAAFDRAFEQLRVNQGGQIGFSGVAGLGKSRLLEELRLQAQLNGAIVLSGSAAEDGTPFGAFLAPLREALTRLDREQIEPERAALGTLLPELALAGDLALDPQRERSRLYAAIASVLASLCRQAPVVLTLDDWHWADTSSRDLLDALERSCASRPLLVVLASRTHAEGWHALKALTSQQLVGMLGAMLCEAEPDASLVERIAEATAGNPLAIEGTLGHLVTKQTLVREGGKWRLKGEWDLPDSAQALFEEHFASLTEEARHLATVAAAWGRPFRLSQLMPALRSEDETLSAIAELEHAGILNRRSEVYRFVGGQQAELIRKLAPPESLRAIHGALAAAIDGEDLESLNARARHILRSDRPADAVESAIAAARKNISLCAVDEARELLGLALPHAKGPHKRDAWHLLGDAERIAANLDLAERYYRSALGAEPSPVQDGVIRTSLGVVAQMRSDYKGALTHFVEASARLEPEPREWLRTATYQARCHYFSGQIPEAIACAREALTRARTFCDPVRLSACLGLLGMLYALADKRPREGIALLAEALTRLEPLGDKVGISDTLNLMGNAQVAAAEYAGAEKSFERALELCEELGIRNDATCALINLAMVALDRGHALAAEQHARRAARQANEDGNAFYEGFATVLLAAAQVALGHIEEALNGLKALGQSIDESNRYLRVVWLSFGAEIQLSAGRLIETCLWAERALEEAKRSGTSEYAPRAGVALAEALIRMGEHDSARRELEQVPVNSPAHEANVEFLWALLALREGQIDEAVRRGSTALAGSAAVGADRLTARIRILLGEAALSRSATPAAMGHFNEARAIAARTEAPLLACHAGFGLAACLDRRERHEALAAARLELSVIQDRLSPESAHDLLSLEELWRIKQGDFESFRSPDSGSIDRRYLDALERERELRAELDRLGAANRRLEVLHRFSTETLSITDFDALLERMVELAASLLDADAGLLLLEASDGSLQVRSSYNVEPDKVLAFSRSIAEASFKAGETTFVSDALQTAEFGSQRSVMDLQIRSALCVPLKASNRVLGVIYVDRQTVHEGFIDHDRLLAEAIALHAVRIIENAQLYAESRDRARKLEMLNSLARTVSTSLVLPEVLDRVTHATLELTGAARVMVLMRGDDGMLACKTASDRNGPLEPETVEFSRSIGHQVLANGEPICTLDTRDHQELALQRSIVALDLRTVMCVPLPGREQAIGVLYVDSSEVVGAFGEHDLDLLQAIASQASIAITNAQLYERATVDALTQLYVRSFFEQRLSAEASRAARYGKDVSVLMMDIDHFKKFNDTYGHATGDEVLKLVASVVKTTIRQELDTPARFGGEEMLVLMPETGPEGALVLAERLRKAIEQTELARPEGDPLKVTVSVGVATLPAHAMTPVELIEAADAALYFSKRNGRNRTTGFQPGMSAEA